jgi:hypothetical protein
MGTSLRLERVALQYIAGLLLSFGVSISIFAVCDVLPESWITFMLFLFCVFVALPSGALLGMCFVDELVYKFQAYDKLAITVGFLFNIPGVMVGIFFVVMGWFPNILDTPQGELWFPFIPVIFSLIGYDFVLLYRSKSKRKVTTSKEGKMEVASEITTEEGVAKRTSRLAIASLICLFAAIPSVVLFLLLLGLGAALPSVRVVAGLFSSAALVLGLAASVLIALRRKVLKGFRYSILVIILSAYPVHETCDVWYVAKSRVEQEQADSSLYKLKVLHGALDKYSKDNNGYLPVADKWGDILIGHNGNLTEDNFRHPKAQRYGLVGDCHFAFNKNLSGLRLADIPGDVVLVFESDGDWNLNGGLELFQKRPSLPDPTRGIIINVLLVDGTIDEYLYKYTIITKVVPSGLIDKQPRWKP